MPRNDDPAIDTDHVNADQFYLVQRLTKPVRAAREGAVGIDKYFRLDYMGSAESEVGRQKESLTRIRAAGNPTIEGQSFTRDGQILEVLVVTAAAFQDAAWTALNDWIVDEMRTKEQHGFGDVLLTGRVPSHHPDLVAWWALGADVMWTIDRDVAENLLAGLEKR